MTQRKKMFVILSPCSIVPLAVVFSIFQLFQFNGGSWKSFDSGCSIRQISLRTKDSTSTLVFLRNASRGTTFVWSIRQNISLSNVWRSKSREMSKKRTQFERGKSKLEILNFHRLLFGSLWKNFGRPDFWNSLIMGPPGLSMVSVETLNITL